MKKRLFPAKRALTAIAVTLVLLGTTACYDHNDFYDQTLKVGNIMLTDLSVVAPTSYDEEIHHPLGVIYHVSHDTAYVVGMREMGKYAYATYEIKDSVKALAPTDGDIADALEYYRGASEKVTALDGKSSTAVLLQKGSPAAIAASNNASVISGWYLPSAGELKKMANNIREVRFAMRVIAGDEFSSEQYLSSTQDGTSDESKKVYCYTVNVTHGYLTTVRKDEPHWVRPSLMVNLR